jgi:hypothetical protein
MDNYTIDIDYLNENDERENIMDGYSIILNFKYNSIKIYTLYTNFKEFYNNFVEKYDSNATTITYTLEELNGGIFIHKDSKYLRFNVERYSTDCQFNSNFIVKINSEIDKMIISIKNFKVDSAIEN